MTDALEAYIDERYGNLGDPKKLRELYEAYLEKSRIETHSYPFGFYTAKPQGDAYIVFDLYTSPRYRKQAYAWKLFDQIRSEAQRLHKNVIIGFSEHLGRNHKDGTGAMEAAGFLKAYSSDIGEIFMRGTH